MRAFRANPVIRVKRLTSLWDFLRRLMVMIEMVIREIRRVTYVNEQFRTQDIFVSATHFKRMSG